MFVITKQPKWLPSPPYLNTLCIYNCTTWLAWTCPTSPPAATWWSSSCPPGWRWEAGGHAWGCHFEHVHYFKDSHQFHNLHHLDQLQHVLFHQAREHSLVPNQSGRRFSQSLPPQPSEQRPGWIKLKFVLLLSWTLEIHHKLFSPPGSLEAEHWSAPGLEPFWLSLSWWSVCFDFETGCEWC